MLNRQLVIDHHRKVVQAVIGALQGLPVDLDAFHKGWVTINGNHILLADEGDGNGGGEAGTGGSGDGTNKVVGQIKDKWGGRDVVEINDASDLVDNYKTIVVGRNKDVVYATKDREFHNDLIKVVDPGANEDNYVRFSSDGHHLEVATNSAGIRLVNDDDEIQAVNHIYKALDKLTNRGLPHSTPVKIFKTHNKVINTTAKMLNINAVKFNFGQDIDSIMAEYEQTIATSMADYLQSDKPITAFRNEFRRAVNDAFTMAFYAGWSDGGGAQPIPDSEIAQLNARIDAEIGFADELFSALKDLRDNPDATQQEMLDFVDARSAGYTATVNSIYADGKVRANTDLMLTFGGSDGNESCETCQGLHGASHPASWWVENGLVPAPGNRNYICNGYNCQHTLTDKDGNVIASGGGF